MTIVKILSLVFCLGFITPAFAARAAGGGGGESSWFFTPSAGLGFNTAQKSYVSLGLDIGLRWDENVYFGIGGHYAAGQHPSDDREIGGGPFIGASYPLFEMLSLQAREDIEYVDVYEPIEHIGNPNFYTHESHFGIESATYVGFHIRASQNFGVSVGYRYVLGISNTAIADGRSGIGFGLTIGI